MGRTLTVMSLNQKLEIIKHANNKTKTKKELAIEHSCDVSTITRILRSEDQLRKIALANPKRKKSRTSVYQDIDKALSDWFHKARLQNTTINTPVLLTKAQQFATKLKSSFKPNNGWLWRWQRRENVKFKKFQNVDLDESFETHESKRMIGNALSKEEAIDKVPTSPHRKKDEHVPDFSEALEALVVLRKFMEKNDLDVGILDQLEEKVVKSKKSRTEGTTDDGIWGPLVCPSTKRA